MTHGTEVFTPEAAAVVVAAGIAIAVYAHHLSQKTNRGEAE